MFFGKCPYWDLYVYTALMTLLPCFSAKLLDTSTLARQERVAVRKNMKIIPVILIPLVDFAIRSMIKPMTVSTIAIKVAVARNIKGKNPLKITPMRIAIPITTI